MWLTINTCDVILEEDGKTDTQLLSYLIELCMVKLGGVPYVLTNFTAPKEIFEKVFASLGEFDVKQVGSIVDLLYLPKLLYNEYMYGYNTDFDTLFIPKLVFISDEESNDQAQIAVMEPTDYGSYVKLKYNVNCRYKLPPDMLAKPNDQKASSSSVMYVSGKHILDHVHCHMDKNNVNIVGPSLQTQQHAISTHNSITTADRVFAFRNPKWPNLAHEWKTRWRPNNWPKQSLINEIQLLGSHVVAKGILSKEYDITWRISFNIAERYMADLLTLQQRKCIVTIKTLIKDAKIEAVSSYHLKSIMWWMVEQDDISMWDKNDVGTNFLAYCDAILKALEKGVIKNYFMPDCNMIQEIEKSELEKAVNFFKSIGQKPITSVLKSRSLIDFEDVQDLKCYLLHFNGDNRSKRFLLKYFSTGFRRFGVSLIRDPNMRENGLHLLQIATFLEKSCDADSFIVEVLLKAIEDNPSDSCYYLAIMLTIIPAKDAIKKLEENKHDIIPMFVNAGRAFHYWTKIRFKTNHRSDDLEFAEKCFKTAIRLNPNHPDSYAEYSYFLYVENKLEEALTIAEECISKSLSTREYGYLKYTTRFKETLDLRLREHVNYNHPEHCINVPSPVMAHYVVVLANLRTGKSKKAIADLEKFKQVCVDKNNKQLKNSQKVYDYACDEIEMYKEASKASQMTCNMNHEEASKASQMTYYRNHEEASKASQMTCDRNYEEASKASQMTCCIDHEEASKASQMTCNRNNEEASSASENVFERNMDHEQIHNTEKPEVSLLLYVLCNFSG